MGNKVLRQRLRGPALASYYPRKLATIKDVKKQFGPELATWDDVEEDRLQYIEEYDGTPSPIPTNMALTNLAVQTESTWKEWTEEEVCATWYVYIPGNVSFAKSGH